MRNKKYKRIAKRLKGECLKEENCCNCNYKRYCNYMRIYHKKYRCEKIKYINIRLLEQVIKNN